VSIRSLANIAVARDTPEAADGVGAATGVLVAAIPTEVLAPYTALIGVVVSTANHGSDYETFRWWLFGVATALVIVALTVAFYRGKPEQGRHLPFVEILAATFAFAAWGLVMPGSPLSLVVTGDALTIVTATIAIGGAFFVTLLVPTIAKPSSKSPAAS
jgi:hypothetical protein